MTDAAPTDAAPTDAQDHSPSPTPSTSPAPDIAAWDAFVESHDPGSYLQLGGWAMVKAVNGWSAHRLVVPDRIGAQILVRRPRPLPWGFAYAPRGPVGTDWSADELAAFTSLVRGRLRRDAGRVAGGIRAGFGRARAHAAGIVEHRRGEGLAARAPALDLDRPDRARAFRDHPRLVNVP